MSAGDVCINIQATCQRFVTMVLSAPRETPACHHFNWDSEWQLKTKTTTTKPSLLLSPGKPARHMRLCKWSDNDGDHGTVVSGSCNIPYITAKANGRHFGFHGKISLGYLFAIVFCCVIIIMWGWLGTEPKASHEFFQITPCWVSLSQTGRKSCEGDTAWPSVRRTQPTCSPDVLTLVVPCLAFPIVAATLREKADTLWVTGHRAIFLKILRTRSLSGWVTQSSLHSILKYFHSGQ